MAESSGFLGDDDVIRLIVDIGDSSTQLDKIDKALTDVGATMQSITGIVNRFDTETKKNVATITAYTETNKKLSLSVEAVGSDLKVLNSVVTSSAEIFDKAKEANGGLTAQEEARSRAIATEIEVTKQLVEEEAFAIEVAEHRKEVLKQQEQLMGLLIDQEKLHQVSLNAEVVALQATIETGRTSALEQQAALLKRLTEEEELRQITLQNAASTEAEAATEEEAYSASLIAAAEASAKERQQLEYLVEKYGEVGIAAEEAGNKSEEGGQRSLFSWSNLGKFFATHLIYTAIYKIIGALKESVDAARQFDLQVAEIQTISLDAAKSTQEWTESLVKLSDQFAKPLADVAEAEYQALSSQIVNATNSTQFLTSALEFSKITALDATHSVNLLTTAINSYGLSADDTEAVAGKFARTIELGKLRASELSEVFGRTAQISKQLGVSFEEVLAGIATLSRQGLPAREAITLINNLLIGLEKQSGDTKEIFKSLNVESGKAAIANYGFLGTLQQIQQQVQLNNKELSDAFPNIRSLRGAIGFLDTGAAQFNETLGKINDSADNYAQKKAVFDESPAFKVSQEFEKIKNIFTVEFGNRVIELLDHINSVARGGLSNELKRVGTALSLISPLLKTNLLLVESYITAVDSTYDAVSKFFSFFGLSNSEAEKIEAERKKQAEEGEAERTQKYKEELDRRFNDFKKEKDKELREQLDHNKDHLVALEKLGIDLRDKAKELNENLKVELTVETKIKQQTISDIKDTITKLKGEIQNAIKEAQLDKIKINEEIFRFNVEEAIPKEQIILLQNKVKEIVKAQAALLKGTAGQNADQLAQTQVAVNKNFDEAFNYTKELEKRKATLTKERIEKQKQLDDANRKDEQSKDSIDKANKVADVRERLKHGKASNQELQDALREQRDTNQTNRSENDQERIDKLKEELATIDDQLGSLRPLKEVQIELNKLGQQKLDIEKAISAEAEKQRLIKEKELRDAQAIAKKLEEAFTKIESQKIEDTKHQLLPKGEIEKNFKTQFEKIKEAGVSDPKILLDLIHDNEAILKEYDNRAKIEAEKAKQDNLVAAHDAEIENRRKAIEKSVSTDKDQQKLLEAQTVLGKIGTNINLKSPAGQETQDLLNNLNATQKDFNFRNAQALEKSIETFIKEESKFNPDSEVYRAGLGGTIKFGDLKAALKDLDQSLKDNPNFKNIQPFGPQSSIGTSSNTTNLGGITINVKGGDTAQATVIEIGKGLERAIRNGTINLNPTGET